MSTTLYKVLAADGSAVHGGRGKWALPSGKRPGKWMPEIKNPVLCQRGYHVVTLEQLPRWLGPALFEVEVAGKRIDDTDKSVVSRARLVRRVENWNERTMRLLACDYAEHVLPIYEKRHPKDMRPRDAIAVARRYANGEATAEELEAARSAAYAAAADAAYAAAYADAAYAAAAAYAYADAAAAARSSERAWQVTRLRRVLAHGDPKEKP